MLSCSSVAVVKPGYDFSKIHTVSIAPINDFESFPGSGEIVSRSLIHQFMKLGLNVVEREKLEQLYEEAAISQVSTSSGDYKISLSSPDVFFVCTITEFTDHLVVVIPISTMNKGRTVTEIVEESEPVLTDDEEIEYKTTTTETVTNYEGDITESKQIKYINSAVGINVQMISKETGEILWSSNYRYTSLSLSDAVFRCTAGVVNPLKKVFFD